MTFVASGLPNGTNWTVTDAGQAHPSLNGTVSFALGNGTHTFRIGAVSGYVHSAVPTSARVLGGPVVVLVTFRT